MKMEVQFNPNNFQNHNLPLTITPVIHAALTRIPEPTVAQQNKPELTFHCICCKEFFVNPFDLYQHMNAKHPDVKEEMEEHAEVADDEDYSWVLEPVCELIDLAEKSVDDSDSDSDSDDDDDTSSSSSTTSSSTSTATTNTNSNTQDEPTMAEHSAEGVIVQKNSAYEEEEAESTISSNSASGFPAINLKTADPRESTSIILLNPVTEVAPPATIMNEKTIPTVVKVGRGRRSAAQTLHLSMLNNGETKCFQCSHCEASFPNAGDLSKHVRSHITNKPFQCSICEKTFTHIGSLNTHIRIHSGEKPYKCELCAKAFTQSSSLMVHMRSHSIRKPHQCHLCDKGFVNSSSLVLHLKSHDDVETFTCPECDKQFKQESLLDEHMRMHTHELVYQCSICRNAFRSSSELVQHMKCHMGEKPFMCSICDRSFTQSGSLNIHMRIHTGEKPFHCKYCDKAFTQASSLSVHLKIHSGEKPFPCHICGKSYSQQAYLNKHIQAHIDLEKHALIESAHENMPQTLFCIVCGALHQNADALALHVTQHHSTLLQNMKDMHAQMHSTDFSSDAERHMQQQQYMQQFELMLQMQQRREQPASVPMEDNGVLSEEEEFEDVDYAAEEEVETATD